MRRAGISPDFVRMYDDPAQLRQTLSSRGRSSSA